MPGATTADPHGRPREAWEACDEAQARRTFPQIGWIALPSPPAQADTAPLYSAAEMDALRARLEELEAELEEAEDALRFHKDLTRDHDRLERARQLAHQQHLDRALWRRHEQPSQTRCLQLALRELHRALENDGDAADIEQGRATPAGFPQSPSSYVTHAELVEGGWRCSLPLVESLSDLVEVDLTRIPNKLRAVVAFTGAGMREVTIHCPAGVTELGWIDLRDFPGRPYDL